MPTDGRRVGPASLLQEGTSWLGSGVVFATRDEQLADAAMMLWKIAKAIRGRQGELGLSTTTLAARSGVRRQTITDVTMGMTWPDLRTLGRICSALGLEMTLFAKGGE